MESRFTTILLYELIPIIVIFSYGSYRVPDDVARIESGRFAPLAGVGFVAPCEIETDSRPTCTCLQQSSCECPLGRT